MRFPARNPSHAARRLWLAFAAFLCSAFASTAWADPPGRVGRLGEMSGQVWLYTPDAGEWISAVRNRPLTSGDRVATDAGGRAEIRIGSSSVRLDGGTELEVLQLDDERIALQLHSGAAGVRLRTAEAAREFEIKTSEGRFTAHRAGRYRFDRGDETSHVTVWSGEALYEGPASALTVYGGQRAEFWIDRNNAAQYSITEPQRDSFAAWNSERDRQDDRSASTRYVSPEMTGVEDLDRHGRWEQAPEYGAVWVPRVVPVGWAPYSAGHWAWISPWGWTWVDDMPWGFAPFHYGRWVMHHRRWGWVPGTYVRHPVYAPALVGWVGGPHVSIDISIGNRHPPAVGWFPLAPHEVYVPTYRVSPGYVQQVNITHVTRITNVTTIVDNPQQAVTHIDYRHRRHPHAVTVVPQSVMTSRQPVAPAAAQFRTSALVQQIVNQPAGRGVVSAPPVAAPVITPAIAEARRMRIHEGERGQPGGRVQPLAPAAPVVVPPSPSRIQNPATRAFVDGENRARPGEATRRRDMHEDGRSIREPSPGVNPGGAPAAPAQAARALVSPPAQKPPSPAVVPVPPPPAQPATRHLPPPQAAPPEERRMRAHPAMPAQQAVRPPPVPTAPVAGPGRAPQVDHRPVQQPQPQPQPQPKPQPQPQPPAPQVHRGQPAAPQVQPAQPAQSVPVPADAGRKHDKQDPEERGRGRGDGRAGRQTELR
jgi:hypothetical protein